MRFDRIIRSDADPLNGDHEEEDRFSRILRGSPSEEEEEERFSRILRGNPTDPEVWRKHLANPEFYRVVRKANPEEEVRFQRILRKNPDSEPSGFQEMVWEEDNPESLDSDDSRFHRSLREAKDQRATQGACSPMGKRSEVAILEYFRIDVNQF